MSLFKKFWLLWIVERQYASMSRVFTGVFSHMAAIASLFILCAQLLLLFLGSLAWLAYTLLTGHGLPPEEAGIILCASVLGLLACCVLTLRRAFGDMQNTVHHEIHKKPSLTHAVTRIADSFMEGIQADRLPRQ